MPVVSLVEFGRELRRQFSQIESDRQTLTKRAFNKKYPPRLTPAQERAARKRMSAKIVKAGGTPWEVWTEGYKGMGATIPNFAGVYDAPNFEAAVEMAKAESGWVGGWDGPPYHDSEEEAWAGYDKHWAAIGGVYAPNMSDPRRPPKEIPG